MKASTYQSSSRVHLKFRQAAMGLMLLLGLIRPLPGYGAERASVLDGWLNMHPEVAQAIVWEFPPIKKFKKIRPRLILWPAPGRVISRIYT